MSIQVSLPTSWESARSVLINLLSKAVTVTGNNTGDQTTIVGITGTKAQFNTACTDGDFLYVGDVTAYTDENAQDAIGTAIAAGTQTGMTVTYNDAANSLSFSSASTNPTTNLRTLTADLTIAADACLVAVRYFATSTFAATLAAGADLEIL